jgi:cholest-4-en-3-one 26-monooxygenase
VFSPRLVASLEEYARAFVIELVEAAVAKRQFDFVTEIAYPLSLIAFCELLGIPDEDREHLGRISEKHFFLDRKLRKDFREFQRARKAEQLGYLIDLIDARRRDPRDDLITRVVAANDADELTDEQAVRFLDLLVDAGKDTTRYAIIGGQLALIQHPDQRERLLADRSLAARATEEILRWTTPINHDARTLTEDVTLRGVTMKRGDRAVVFYASANRDEAAFPDPERLDLGRDPNPHVTFGAGPHICLGKALTRLEIRLFIEEVAPRLAGAELVAPPRRIRTPFISGYETLPLALP